MDLLRCAPCSGETDEIDFTVPQYHANFTDSGDDAGDGKVSECEGLALQQSAFGVKLSKQRKSISSILQETGRLPDPEVFDCKPSERDELVLGRERTYQSNSEDLEHRFSKLEGFQVGLPNKVLEWFWPHIAEYVSTTIRMVVEPALKKALSTAFSSLGTSFAFDPARCHLGDTPVEVSRLEGRQSTQGDLKNVCFTASVKWNGKPEVFFTVSKMELGVRDVRFAGIVSVELVGMQPKPLFFFQGVRMYLVNQPLLEIQFEGSFHSWLNHGSIKSMILDTVLDKISERVVVPNRVGRPLCPEADWFQIAHPVPEGVLTFTVHTCENLIASDVSFLRAKSSDPYVIVSSGAHKFKSHVVKRNLNPKFGFTCRFCVASVNEQVIEIAVQDHDKVSKDDFLGGIKLPVAVVKAWEDSQFCFQLADAHGAAGKNGKIWLSAIYKPIRKFVHDDSRRSGLAEVDKDPVYIFAGVYQCSQVPRMRDGTKFWVEIDCDNAHHSDGSSSLHVTEKLSQHGVHWQSQDRASHDALMRRKLDLLQKYHVSQKDISEILEVGESQLEEITENHLRGNSELLFNSGVDYIVDDLEKAVISFTLKCQREEKSKKADDNAERNMGSFAVSGAELMLQPMYERTVTLPGNSVLMKIQVQLRILA